MVGIKQSVSHADDQGDIHHVLRMTDIPDPDIRLQASDVLLILGTDENINRFIGVKRGP